MSIKPQYADLIFSGKKTIELRRVCPKLKAGDLVMVYASGPKMALVGGFEVGGIVSGTPSSVYKDHGAAARISKKEFDKYFSGTSTAFGIVIKKVWLLIEADELKSLRIKFKGFNPPQSYRYLRAEERMALVPQGKS